MPARAPAIPKTRAEPLTKSERLSARAVAERLAVEVTRLLGAIDPAHRNAFALARLLKADRTACQRLLSAIATVDEHTPARAPGVKSLRTLIDAVEAYGLDASIIRGLREAAEQLEHLFIQTGGHQRLFAERLLVSAAADSTPTAQASPAGDRSAVDEQFFETARRITGRWSDVHLRLAAIRPSPEQPGACDVLRGRGHLGHVQMPGAIPLTLMHTYDAVAGSRAYVELRPARSHGMPTFMLDEYSSPDWRVSNYLEGRMLIQSIEADPDTIGHPRDLVLANASYGSATDPRFDNPAIQEVWVQFEYPARRLLMDVYLHADLARGVTSGGDVHALRTHDIAELRQVHLRWMTRIGQPWPLALLGMGIEGAASRAYPRQRELTETLFRSVGWDPGEFVGFRLEIPFPLWRTAARAYFDMPAREM